ncbi:MAG: FAD/NAD(P)-binding oxidoreductase [Polyangiales bacterium]
MKHLVILGAGTAGTIVANGSRRRLSADWEVIVVDPSIEHLYQPGLLFVPFGGSTELARPRVDTFAHGVDWVRMGVDGIDPHARKVSLSNGETLPYDVLVVATGCRIRPDLLPGLTDAGWNTTQHEFYTLTGAKRLEAALTSFQGGRVVVDLVESRFKSPLAPVEFLFLLDEHLTRRGLRARCDLVLATPLDAVFHKARAAAKLDALLAEKGIRVATGFAAASVDGERRLLRAHDGRTEPYDLLVSVPTHSGARWAELGGHGDQRAFIATDPHTLRAKGMDNVFVLGDATDLPTSKAGSVAHFQAEVLVGDLARIAEGADPLGGFDGHANCFVETGHGKAILIDFSDDVEPLPGTYPIPGVGPFTLLEETRRNHWGKRAFEWMYWNGLLPAHPMPVPTHLSMAGKHLPREMHHPY